MKEPDILTPDDHDMFEDDPWGEFMEDQIFAHINNLNPGLAASDYSLNSPLIRDCSDALLLFLQTGNTTAHFAQNMQFLKTANAMRTHINQVDWCRVKSAELFHEWVSSARYQGRSQTREFEQMLSKNLPAARDAISIVAAFWKSITGNDLQEENLLRGQFDYDGVGIKARDWGEKFWIAHTLVNLINCTTAPEKSPSKTHWTSVLLEMRTGSDGSWPFQVGFSSEITTASLTATCSL
jgi:hypothetical protein